MSTHTRQIISILVILVFINSATSISSSKSIDDTFEISSLQQHQKSINALKNIDQTSNGSILAGAAVRTITPDLSIYDDIYLAGFDRNRKATGIHDDLWSRCCCIQIGNVTIAFVSVDLIGVMYHEYLSILDSLPENVTIDHLLLTSTHNHEGPDVIGLWGSGLKTGIHWQWYQEALDQISESIIKAYQSMEPAGLRFGHDVAHGFSRDSRDPIIMEEQVETIQVVSSDLQPIATMVCFASHPEVLWSQNTLITSDYPHYLYQTIAENNGGTALLLTGPIGGLITPNVSSHTFIDAQKYGEDLANISLSSVQDSDYIWETSITLKIREILVPLTNPIFRLASIINILARPLFKWRQCLLTAVSSLELGTNGDLVQLVTVPGEDFPENWFEIKQNLTATHKIHIGLCMDELGYIVPKEDFDPTDYEESMSASRFLDPIIHTTLEDMLDL